VACSHPQPVRCSHYRFLNAQTSPSPKGTWSADHPTEGRADARRGRCSEGLTVRHLRSFKKVVKKLVTFTDLVAYFRARFGVEDGQTMAEYGVVLAVITALVVAAILALSGAIANALDTVRGYL
jgi:Flp pilus assembly pilin Flp